MQKELWVQGSSSVQDKVAKQLVTLIEEGRLAPGEKLPSERQLTALLRVSRSSLREALKRLEASGYVDIHQRRGVFVKSVQGAISFSPLKNMVRSDERKIVQLYEVRRDLEEASAYAAAMERTTKDLEEIQKRQKSFSGKDEESFFSWENDEAFHVAIARASHNIFRIHSIMNILDFSREFIKPIMEGFAESESNKKEIVFQHQQIVEAIVSKDEQKAREKMRSHLNWTYGQLIEHFS